MKTTRAHIEKAVNKHGKITVYSPTNIPLDIYTEPCICRTDIDLEFEMDFTDLINYCNNIGLFINPNKK